MAVSHDYFARLFRVTVETTLTGEVKHTMSLDSASAKAGTDITPNAAKDIAADRCDATGSATMTSIDRRSLLIGSGVVAAGVATATLVRRSLLPRETAFIARNQRYEGDLRRVIRDGLQSVGFPLASLRGKRVLLKPNLVEPNRESPHMTTHPAMIVAAAEVFRSAGAEVTVGEAPGHIRDTEMALVESGVREALDDAKLDFADLNYDDVVSVANQGRASKLKRLWFPRHVTEADLVVSMPKMKTHHWVGVTAAMKNLYGTLPGIKYGWPKNVLHYHGIPQTVFDINASLPKSIAIVDAIECMEGDGPIMGTMKPMGLVLVGTNLAAVDATICRLMDIIPERVEYLALAADRLGPLDESRIEQRGEHWQSLSQSFHILDRPHLSRLRENSPTLAT